MSTKIQIKVENNNFLRIYLINIDIFAVKLRIWLEIDIFKTLLPTTLRRNNHKLDSVHLHE